MTLETVATVLKILEPVSRGARHAYDWLQGRRRKNTVRQDNAVLRVRTVRIGTDPLDAPCIEVTITNERPVPIT